MYGMGLVRGTHQPIRALLRYVTRMVPPVLLACHAFFPDTRQEIKLFAITSSPTALQRLHFAEFFCRHLSSLSTCGCLRNNAKKASANSARVGPAAGSPLQGSGARNKGACRPAYRRPWWNWGASRDNWRPTLGANCRDLFLRSTRG